MFFVQQDLQDKHAAVRTNALFSLNSKCELFLDWTVNLRIKFNKLRLSVCKTD